MTMVIENQSRQYGGIGFDNPVYHHNAPHFSDPWAAAHSSSHSSAPMYASSMGSSQLPLNSVKHEDVSRPSPMSMSYPSLPVSAPSLVAGNNYSSSYPSPEVMGMQNDMARSGFDQAPTYTTASPMGNFAPASYPMGYAPSLQQQDNRRMSHA